jgi:hypothetical protein
VIIRRLRFAALVAVLVAAPVLASHAAASPIAGYLKMCMNDVCTDLSNQVRGSGSGVSDFDIRIVNADAEVHLVGLMDADPFVSLAVTTTLINDVTMSFAFYLGTLIVPDFYNYATSSQASTLFAPLKPSSLTTSAINASYLSGSGVLGAVPTNLGVDTGTNPCNAVPGGPTVTCTATGAANTFSPTSFDALEGLLTFTQTGPQSVGTWEVLVTLEKKAVPEPLTLSLLGLGVVGVVARRRARR